MNIRQELEVIQKTLALSQTALAARLGVSFVAYNNWWNGKATPRRKKQVAIEDLFLEVTGQKIIPADRLVAKKSALKKKSAQYTNVLATILNNPDIRDEFVLKLTYNTNRIEGSTLTELDTAAILFDNAALPNKSLIEHLEAKNHQAALLFLFEYLFKKGHLDEALVLKLHAILMNGIRLDAGMYRRHAVRIVGVNLPTANYVKIPDLMSALISDVEQKSKDIFTLATYIHSRFEQIHPFSDGNGRVGRLLMAAMLLRSNYSPALIRQEKKRLYYTFLYKAQTKADLSQLEDLICDAVADGFAILERRI